MEKRCHFCNKRGPVYVELHTKGKAKSICEKCYKSEIAVPRQPVDDQDTCGECDVIVNKSDRYCHSCGNLLEMRCKNCEKKVKSSDRFCSNCGEKVF